MVKVFIAVLIGTVAMIIIFTAIDVSNRANPDEIAYVVNSDNITSISVSISGEITRPGTYLMDGNSDLGEHTLLTRLPFQVCEWTCIFAIFMVLTENKHFFDIDVVVCLTLGITPLFMPAVIQRTGPRYFRYYQFWLEHIVPIYAVFYMMFVKGFKYDVKTVYKPLIFLVVLSLICMYFNAKIPEATYMYLQGDDLGETITNMLPPTQYGRFFVFMGLGIVLFGLHFLVFFLIRKYAKKKEVQEEIA